MQGGPHWPHALGAPPCDGGLPRGTAILLQPTTQLMVCVLPSRLMTSLSLSRQHLDDVVERLAARLPPNSLLLVLGDHGMCDSGEHGTRCAAVYL